MHNEIKSDVFSLGVILLQLATLTNQDSFYDFFGYNIDGRISQQLESLDHFDKYLLQMIE